MPGHYTSSSVYIPSYIFSLLRYQLNILLEQRKDLSTAIEQLLADIEAGRKYMKVYKQMKMYNDPALNPVLYAKK